MRTHELAEGFNILAPYYKNPKGYHHEAEHDIIYASSTDEPLSFEDVKRMIDLGWIQEYNGYSPNEVFSEKHYRWEEQWVGFG